MSRAYQRAISAAALCCVWAALPAAATTIYGVTADDKIVKFNTTTGITTLQSTLSSAGSGGSGALGISNFGGSYYIFDQNALALRTVDINNGSLGSAISFASKLTTSAEGDLTFSGDTGYILSNAPSNGDFGFTGPLLSFGTAPMGGSQTILTEPPKDGSNNELAFDGLAYDPVGHFLYALTEGGDQIYRASTATPTAWTLIGATNLLTNGCNGFPCYGFGGLTYSVSDGKFYGALSRSSVPVPGTDPAGVYGTIFFEINTSNGNATVLGHTDSFLMVSGITNDFSAGPPPPEVPEPATWALGGVSLLALGYLRGRRKA